MKTVSVILLLPLFITEYLGVPMMAQGFDT